MTTVTINSVIINNTTFYQKGSITSVDLRGASWTNNTMCNAFYGCSNLTTVTNINTNNVVNMERTFWQCYNLVAAPAIPNSVISLYQTFYQCYNLVTVPAIPNSILSMYQTFQGCRNLVTAPIIPNSVTDIRMAFYSCNNLTGNIFIESNSINRISDCFDGTSLPKNIYIPFTYSNGVNTKTYNSFTSAGYKTDGSLQNVYLKDIGTL